MTSSISLTHLGTFMTLHTLHYFNTLFIAILALYEI